MGSRRRSLLSGKGRPRKQVKDVEETVETAPSEGPPPTEAASADSGTPPTSPSDASTEVTPEAASPSLPPVNIEDLFGPDEEIPPVLAKAFADTPLPAMAPPARGYGLVDATQATPPEEETLKEEGFAPDDSLATADAEEEDAAPSFEESSPDEVPEIDRPDEESGADGLPPIEPLPDEPWAAVPKPSPPGRVWRAGVGFTVLGMTLCIIGGMMWWSSCSKPVSGTLLPMDVASEPARPSEPPPPDAPAAKAPPVPPPPSEVEGGPPDSPPPAAPESKTPTKPRPAPVVEPEPQPEPQPEPEPPTDPNNPWSTEPLPAPVTPVEVPKAQPTKKKGLFKKKSP